MAQGPTFYTKSIFLVKNVHVLSINASWIMALTSTKRESLEANNCL